jgi:hypothetical protein
MRVASACINRLWDRAGAHFLRALRLRLSKRPSLPENLPLSSKIMRLRLFLSSRDRVMKKLGLRVKKRSFRVAGHLGWALF